MDSHGAIQLSCFSIPLSLHPKALSALIEPLKEPLKEPWLEAFEGALPPNSPSYIRGPVSEIKLGCRRGPRHGSNADYTKNVVLEGLKAPFSGLFSSPCRRRALCRVYDVGAQRFEGLGAAAFRWHISAQPWLKSMR